MNEQEFMKITGGIDEGLVAEYGALTPKKRISAKRGAQIAIGAAAAAALAIPAGAYAYNTFIHKENVEFYLSGSDRLEAQDGCTMNNVMENEHLTITIDVMLSDGHNVFMVETYEQKDEIGERICKAELSGTSLLTYADGTPGPYIHGTTLGDVPCIGGGGGFYIGNSGDPHIAERRVAIYSCEGIDLEKDVKITWFAADDSKILPENYFWEFFPEESMHVFKYDGEITNLLEGIEYVTSFAPNVQSVPLHSENGDEIFMSEFEVWAEDRELLRSENGYTGFDEFYFILNNGEKRQLNIENHASGGGDYMTFGEVIDTDDYAGVEICGVEYLK